MSPDDDVRIWFPEEGRTYRASAFHLVDVLSGRGVPVHAVDGADPSGPYGPMTQVRALATRADPIVFIVTRSRTFRLQLGPEGAEGSAEDAPPEEAEPMSEVAFTRFMERLDA